MNKLDYLAQKEEELRKLNEQLDKRQHSIMKEQQTPAAVTTNLADSLDMRRTGVKNPFEAGEPTGDIMRQSSSSLMSEARKVRESYKQQDNHVKTEDHPVLQLEDEEFNHDEDNGEEFKISNEATGGPKYQMMVDKIKDQEKTINFQKAKIVALQTELEDTIKSTGNVDGRIEDLEKLNQKLTEENKKLNEKLNAQNVSQQKIKTQNTDLLARIAQFEKTVADQAKDIEANERDKKKAFQDQGARDVKLNRAIEELEKYKSQLKEAKVTELSKSDNLKKDMDRMIEENRKLERQRNELMQAFKKQMKLIDVLKRQKMHVEAAKLLAFTEDEFVKTLELGDKM